MRRHNHNPMIHPDTRHHEAGLQLLPALGSVATLFALWVQTKIAARRAGKNKDQHTDKKP